LIGITKNTGAYYASKGIRCNVIAAGAMATNIFQSAGPSGLNMEGLGMLTKHCTIMPHVWFFGRFLKY
jgi:NAD(P)-dependent dehydrogenase (short-subunit alcohol dehydrogenase family)